MATGASGDLLTDADRHAQSVFKHEILRQYIPRFIAMPGSTSRGNRLVVLDGFAGRGRYLNGTPGSAELILRAVRGLARSRDVATFFVEQDEDHYGPLKNVVEEYVAEGLRARALPGAVHDHLDVVLAAAVGVPLFLFLDPCGAGLPFERLRTVLADSRSGQRPPTEVLLNFSADLSRRAAGALVKGRLGDPILPRMDAACGGEWWRAIAVDVLRSAAKSNFEPVAHAVTSEYAKRLRFP